MHLLNGIGAGLIAGGAVALLPTLLAAGPHVPGVIRSRDGLKDLHRDRTARVCASVSAIATLAGASLLLVSSNRWTALVAGTVVLLLAWLALAWRVSREYAQLASYLEMFRGRPKGVPNDAAAFVGLAMFVPGSVLPSDVDAGEAARRAEERASFRRALRRPFGYRDGL